MRCIMGAGAATGQSPPRPRSLTRSRGRRSRGRRRRGGLGGLTVPWAAKRRECEPGRRTTVKTAAACAGETGLSAQTATAARL
ncbi:Hypothetical predicted protein [Marmota monax]|uniref:Uncharacterized protein n=1 Tax=Marmota monax TaxID=9995 RepID=A0A5E4D9C6_MARMO|nr:hypothetical protein GHT09_012658 [Marmota monax]VTJ90360.1 Hypothetical predicted protein [Marmota monax]